MHAIKQDPAIAGADKDHLQITEFHVYKSVSLGNRFSKRVNFITDFETIVPDFYREVGQNLAQWIRPAPKIREPDEVDDLIEIVIGVMPTILES